MEKGLFFVGVYYLLVVCSFVCGLLHLSLGVSDFWAHGNDCHDFLVGYVVVLPRNRWCIILLVLYSKHGSCDVKLPDMWIIMMCGLWGEIMGVRCKSSSYRLS